MLEGISKIIEEMAAENGGSYMEAILDFQEQNNIPDVEDITDGLNDIIKEKISVEMIRKNYFPKGNPIRERFNSIPLTFFEE